MENSQDKSAAVQLMQVLENINSAERQRDVDSGPVTLVAVSKTFQPESIKPVLEAGQRVFGENRVQEAVSKWPGLRQDYSEVKLHLIGPLQTNKTAAAVELFDCIETLDRSKLAKTIAAELKKQQKSMELFIQVNTGAEPQKAGVLASELASFIGYCRDEQDLQISGLMCIPPVDEDPRKHFMLLADLAKKNGLSKLSMGMSADYETAIQCGASHVRVGSAIFGRR